MVEADEKPKWTLWREAIGTFVGVSPFVIGLVIWGFGVQERVRVTELKVQYLEQSQAAEALHNKEQRQEIINRLDRISVQVETLQQTVAAQRIITR